jgi:hypothetical protein
LPADVALHETVAVPEPIMLLGVIEPQTRPEGTMSVRVTFPAKPFNAVIVIVEFAGTPILTCAGDVAMIVKSWTRKVAVTLCVMAPFVPVTVTL